MTRDYCDYLIDLLSPWDVVTAKSMFGGFGLYRQGTIFALIADDALYFKVGDTNRPDYEEAGSEPFTYEAKGKRIALSYWAVPSELLDNEEMLCQWAEKAYTVAIQNKKVKKSKPKGALHKQGSNHHADA